MLVPQTLAQIRGHLSALMNRVRDIGEQGALEQSVQVKFHYTVCFTVWHC